MRLFLVRHGEATSKMQDPARPISEAGRAAAARMARWLAATGACAPAEIRHSPKLRARQTAEILGHALGDVARQEVDGLAPLDDVGPVAQALAGERADLMLVGHLPHLDRLASRLVAGDAEAALLRLRPAGVVCLERDEEDRWTLAWAVAPELIA
ncbi:MAG: phosphohistidine phosphatase SixA [Planctomycetota bacterium]|jgi:phosphohistidine phosphatase